MGVLTTAPRHSEGEFLDTSSLQFNPNVFLQQAGGEGLANAPTSSVAEKNMGI